NDNELNQEHSSEKTVNKKKSDSERTEEEQKALQKAIASREKRKKERQNKHQEEPKPKIQIDTSALVRDSEKQDNQEKEEQMDRKTKQSTSEMLGLGYMTVFESIDRWLRPYRYHFEDEKLIEFKEQQKRKKKNIKQKSK